MKITCAEYVTSAVRPEHYPSEDRREVAFMGRSNVGKSSLINKLLNRKKLARTSSQPGKTQTLNYFNINDRFYFVDLPGYGFARVSQAERERWRKMIETYLKRRPEEKYYWQLVDIRHEPTALDRQMYEWLSYYDLRRLVVATKSDKISRGARDKQLALIRKTLDCPADGLVAFSAETGEGKEELWQRLDDFLLA